MAGDTEINLYDIPLAALRPSTRKIVVDGLNAEKVLCSENGLPRDYRGLAHLTKLPSPDGADPTSQLLVAWEIQPKSSLGFLKEFLGLLDRWDVVDDIHSFIREDAKEFMLRMSNNSAVVSRAKADDYILTNVDAACLTLGQDLPQYDALLLFAEKDTQFARQMLDELNDFKVCLKEDLVGGLPSQHSGVMRLISERCHRVIIIISPAFIASPVNQFFVTFAQHIAIERRARVIIPVIYHSGPEKMDLPAGIEMVHKLDYRRSSLRDYNFWEQLRRGVLCPTIRSPQSLPGPSLPAIVSSTLAVQMCL